MAVCFRSKDKDPLSENDACKRSGHEIGLNCIASILLCWSTFGQSQPPKLESVPLSVHRVIVRLAPDITGSNERYASELLDAMNYAASLDERRSVLPGPAVDAVAREMASQSLPRMPYHRPIGDGLLPGVFEICLAQKLMADWILEVKLWPDRNWIRATHVEVGLRSAQWGPILANGFGKLRSSSYPIRNNNVGDFNLHAACIAALSELWEELLPMATVLNTFEERATLTPISHPSVVNGLEGFTVRGKEARTLIYLHSARADAPEIRVIRMHGPMPGDKVVLMNIRKGPSGLPKLSRYYKDRLAYLPGARL